MVNYSTPQHDFAHRWVFDTRNRYKVLESVAQQRRFDLDRDTFYSTIDIERAIFSSNETRKFIVDRIIDLFSQTHCSPQLPNPKTFQNISIKKENQQLIATKRNGVTSFSGKGLHLIPGAI